MDAAKKIQENRALVTMQLILEEEQFCEIVSMLGLKQIIKLNFWLLFGV